MIELLAAFLILLLLLALAVRKRARALHRRGYDAEEHSGYY